MASDRRPPAGDGLVGCPAGDHVCRRARLDRGWAGRGGGFGGRVLPHWLGGGGWKIEAGGLFLSVVRIVRHPFARPVRSLCPHSRSSNFNVASCDYTPRVRPHLGRRFNVAHLAARRASRLRGRWGRFQDVREAPGSTAGQPGSRDRSDWSAGSPGTWVHRSEASDGGNGVSQARPPGSHQNGYIGCVTGRASPPKRFTGLTCRPKGVTVVPLRFVRGAIGPIERLKGVGGGRG